MNSLLFSLLFGALCSVCHKDADHFHHFATDTSGALITYVALNCQTDSVHGYYYGYQEHDRPVLFYRATIKQDSSRAAEINFKLEDYVFSYDPITPYSGKIKRLKRKKVPRSHSLHKDAYANYKNGRLVVDIIPVFGGSATERIVFYRLD